MGANSFLRRLAKSILYPVTNEHTYKYVQAASKALDIKRGNWSEPELDLITIGLKPGETALDIGANYGIYAYYMSRVVGRNGKVYSFEPIPFTFSTLKIVGKLLGFSHNVEFIQKGCSDENGIVEFEVPVQSSGAFAAGQAYIGNRNDDHVGKDEQVRWDSTKTVKAEVIRLDDYLIDDETVTFIKVDIEGAELLCFRGAQNLIFNNKPTIICEINPWFLRGFGLELDDLLSFFTQRDYKIYSYSNADIPRLIPVSPKDIVEDNYIFLHPYHEERFANLLK